MGVLAWALGLWKRASGSRDLPVLSEGGGGQGVGFWADAPFHVCEADSWGLLWALRTPWPLAVILPSALPRGECSKCDVNIRYQTEPT